jgi:hypothetical protein
LTVGNCRIELGSVRDGVDIGDLISPAYRKWEHLRHQFVDLSGRFARVEKDHERRVIRGDHCVRECFGRDDDTVMRLVLLVLEDNQVVVTMSEKCTTCGELGDAVEEVSSRRRGAFPLSNGGQRVEPPTFRFQC